MEATARPLVPSTPSPSPRRLEAAGLHAGAGRSMAPDGLMAFALAADDLADAEALLSELCASNVPLVSEIGRYLAAAGGKRMRPLLTALGARACGYKGPVGRLMCAGELIHLGSLLHDDVVDNGQDRRGAPAAQRVYGNAAVILTGDHCVARALLIAAEEAGLPAVTGLAATVAAMSEAEVQQLAINRDLSLPLERYLSIIEDKSATLIAWCAAAGAWKAGRPELAPALQTFGRAAGIAFQVVDDVIDYTGEMRLTGKRRGQDLAELKPTLPLLLALDRVPGLRAQLAKGPPSPERIPRFIEQVRNSGATDDAMTWARERVTEGIAALDALPPGPHRDALVDLGHALVERNA